MAETSTTTTQRTTTTDTREERGYLVGYKIVYYILGIIETLLLLRFLFRLFGANPGAGVVQLIYSITGVLMAPFEYIFPTNAVSGAVFEWSILVAMALYALVVYAVEGLLSIMYSADTGRG